MKQQHRLKHLPRRDVLAENGQTNAFGVNEAISRFLVSRRSQDCSDKTIETYDRALKILGKFLAGERIKSIYDVDLAVVERFMAYLNKGTQYNQGGRHLIFRTTKTFLGWVEGATDGYSSPMWGFPAPRIEIKPIKGLDLKELELLVGVCDGRNRKRDKALLYFLADTGVRATELIGLNIDSVDLHTGEVHIEKGKWRKSRVVVIGQKTRKALRTYLGERESRPNLPLFATDEGFKLTYWGLRQIIERLAHRANIDEPGLHDFRRLFAVTMHRNGVDDITLAKFMGHSTTEVLKRYLAEDEQDLIRVHRTGSPVDNNLR